ncbi:NVEALA domain-containing protein [Phocaeicola sartorii]|uniref:NVEALA domain-containing protein n=1 Tax=Phocaeicola sartorii TaxID=671267 RepID=UPI0024302EA1|nr:NVEALA domain-containing protein [Phocaeicola sartorii]
MKKKILKATIVASFALIAGMNVYNAQKSDVMSGLALANVEALAYYVERGGSDYECEAPYNSICSTELGTTLYGYRFDYDY